MALLDFAKSDSSLDRTLKGFLAIISEFSKILEKENKCISAFALSDAQKLLDAKNECISKLENVEQEILNLRAQGVEFANHTLNASVQEGYRKLQDLLNQNSILIQSASNVNFKMLEMYKERRSNSEYEHLFYNKKGAVSQV